MGDTGGDSRAITEMSIMFGCLYRRRNRDRDLGFDGGLPANFASGYMFGFYSSLGRAIGPSL
jgi:hypothetical protein